MLIQHFNLGFNHIIPKGNESILDDSHKDVVALTRKHRPHNRVGNIVGADLCASIEQAEARIIILTIERGAFNIVKDSANNVTDMLVSHLTIRNQTLYQLTDNLIRKFSPLKGVNLIVDKIDIGCKSVKDNVNLITKPVIITDSIPLTARNN